VSKGKKKRVRTKKYQTAATLIELLCAFIFLILPGIIVTNHMGLYGSLIHKIIAIGSGILTTLVITNILFYLGAKGEWQICECNSIPYYNYDQVSSDDTSDNPKEKELICQNCGRRYVSKGYFFYKLDDNNNLIPYKKYVFLRGWIDDKR
jgi:hypothetical protein